MFEISWTEAKVSRAVGALPNTIDPSGTYTDNLVHSSLEMGVSLSQGSRIPAETYQALQGCLGCGWVSSPFLSLLSTPGWMIYLQWPMMNHDIRSQDTIRGEQVEDDAHETMNSVTVTVVLMPLEQNMKLLNIWPAQARRVRVNSARNNWGGGAVQWHSSQRRRSCYKRTGSANEMHDSKPRLCPSQSLQRTQTHDRSPRQCAEWGSRRQGTQVVIRGQHAAEEWQRHWPCKRFTQIRGLQQLQEHNNLDLGALSSRSDARKHVGYPNVCPSACSSLYLSWAVLGDTTLVFGLFVRTLHWGQMFACDAFMLCKQAPCGQIVKWWKQGGPKQKNAKVASAKVAFDTKSDIPHGHLYLHLPACFFCLLAWSWLIDWLAPSLVTYMLPCWQQLEHGLSVAPQGMQHVGLRQSLG